jgi:hypothetical protein
MCCRRGREAVSDRSQVMFLCLGPASLMGAAGYNASPGQRAREVEVPMSIVMCMRCREVAGTTFFRSKETGQLLVCERCYNRLTGQTKGTALAPLGRAGAWMGHARDLPELLDRRVAG